MHWVRLGVVHADHLKGSWNSMKAGQVEWVAEANLTRQNSWRRHALVPLLCSDA